MILTALVLMSAQPAISPGEEPVDPYVVSDANAGADPFAGEGMVAAFRGRDGIDRVVDRFVDLNLADPRIGDIFKGHDELRIRRVIKEQFCYLLGAGCAYTGRDMRSAHKDMGLQGADMNALVDNLQKAMSAEDVPFRAQNRFLAKLAPMKRQVVER